MNRPEEFEARYLVEAIRWTGDNLDAVQRFCGQVQPVEGVPEITIELLHLRSPVSVKAGDWIVKYANIFQVVADREFKSSYRKPGPRSALV